MFLAPLHACPTPRDPVGVHARGLRDAPKRKWPQRASARASRLASRPGFHQALFEKLALKPVIALRHDCLECSARSATMPRMGLGGAPQAPRPPPTTGRAGRDTVFFSGASFARGRDPPAFQALTRAGSPRPGSREQETRVKGFSIPVGTTRVTFGPASRPPDRSRRADFLHRAPTSGRP